ncbi:hypothetical protein AAFN85_26415 [Mucilaginibacter sp. CAU 1740]|uniref:hypothetical protein n=1 Tax=Mucilaginibacter sp. CAU 1740 TaxID=3140365 RepID=UPI00325AA37E
MAANELPTIIQLEAPRRKRIHIAKPVKKKDPNLLLKRGIWAYFLLLIFEGALRKWVLPGLSTPLLVVRDPLALWLVLLAWKRNLLPSNLYVNGMMIIGAIAIITALAFGHGNFAVAIYGARILMFHWPLMFVIGKVFDRYDVIKIGQATMWITIPMAMLITAQFYSPQSAFVNRGVGGDMKGGGFDGAMGFFRPPATFSFTNGTALFFGFAAAYVCYFWLTPKSINRLVLLGATLGVLMAIPLSISRSLLSLVLAAILFSFIGISRNPKYIGKVMVAVVALVVIFAVLSQFSFFATPLEVFTHRFTSANETEGGVSGVFVDRFLGGMVGAIIESAQKPFFGYGIGMGTSVGSMLIAGDHTVYLISEGEWGRLIGEMGILMGFAVIIIRVVFVVNLGWNSFKRVAKDDFLPWMICSIGILAIMQGQWAQPTSLGFDVILGGITLAALRKPNRKLYLVKTIEEGDEIPASLNINKFNH